MEQAMSVFPIRLPQLDERNAHRVERLAAVLVERKWNPNPDVAKEALASQQEAALAQAEAQAQAAINILRLPWLPALRPTTGHPLLFGKVRVVRKTRWPSTEKPEVEIFLRWQPPKFQLADDITLVAFQPDGRHYLGAMSIAQAKALASTTKISLRIPFEQHAKPIPPARFSRIVEAALSQEARELQPNGSFPGYRAFHDAEVQGQTTGDYSKADAILDAFFAENEKAYRRWKERNANR